MTVREYRITIGVCRPPTVAAEKNTAARRPNSERLYQLQPPLQFGKDLRHFIALTTTGNS